MAEDFLLSDVIPKELQIPSAGNDLYRIGLSHFCYGSEKRNRFHNPLIIAVLHMLCVLHALLSLSMSEENPDVFIWIVGFY